MPRRPTAPRPSSALAEAARAAGVGLVVRVAVEDAVRAARKLVLRLRIHGAPSARVAVAYDADDTEAVLTASDDAADAEAVS